ncbi:MAG: hypothetical protein RL168_783, partial [Bacteroidota bacterium]
MAATLALIAFLIGLLATGVYAQPCSIFPLPDSTYGFSPIAFDAAENSNRFATKTATSGERIIFYLHGLGGSPENWNLVASRTALGGANQFPARQVLYDSPPSYSQNGGLIDGALDIDQHLQTQAWLAEQMHQIDPDNHLIVAHSLGGLEALILDSLYADSSLFDRPIGGMVLIGSAVAGSQAPFTLSPWGQNGAANFISDACSILSHPALWIPAYLPPLRWFENLDPLLQQTLSTQCSAASHLIVPFALGKFNRPITTELHPQNPLIQKISQRAPSVPVIQVYGVEDEPVFWRTAYSMTVTDSIGMSLAQDPFSFDGDQPLVDWANTQQARYQAQATLAAAAAQHHALGLQAAWWNPVASLYHAWQRQRALEQAEAASDAEQWYRKANDVYEALIGARRIQHEQSGYWCRCRGLNPEDETWSVVTHPSECESLSPEMRCTAWPR